jgi:hypothetical protein
VLASRNSDYCLGQVVLGWPLAWTEPSLGVSSLDWRPLSVRCQRPFLMRYHSTIVMRAVIGCALLGCLPLGAEALAMLVLRASIRSHVLALRPGTHRGRRTPPSCAFLMTTQSSAIHSYSVFIVEDETLLRLMISEMLEELGHHVSSKAGRIEQALLLANAAEFHIALLDVNVAGRIITPIAEIVASRNRPFCSLLNRHLPAFPASIGAPDGYPLLRLTI